MAGGGRREEGVGGSIGGSIGESLPLAGFLEVPLNLRPDPQGREFGGSRSCGLGAAETPLMNQLFHV